MCAIQLQTSFEHISDCSVSKFQRKSTSFRLSLWQMHLPFAIHMVLFATIANWTSLEQILHSVSSCIFYFMAPYVHASITNEQLAMNDTAIPYSFLSSSALQLLAFSVSNRNYFSLHLFIICAMDRIHWMMFDPMPGAIFWTLKAALKIRSSAIYRLRFASVHSPWLL